MKRQGSRDREAIILLTCLASTGSQPMEHAPWPMAFPLVPLESSPAVPGNQSAGSVWRATHSTKRLGNGRLVIFEENERILF